MESVSQRQLRAASQMELDSQEERQIRRSSDSQTDDTTNKSQTEIYLLQWIPHTISFMILLTTVMYFTRVELS